MEISVSKGKMKIVFVVCVQWIRMTDYNSAYLAIIREKWNISKKGIKTER